MNPQDAQTRLALSLAAAAAADRTGEIIDMSGYESAKFAIIFHSVAAGAVTSVKVQQGAESDMSDAADLEGTGISVAADDDGQVFVPVVVKPQERYIRVAIDKDASNNTTESGTVELYGAKTLPALQDVTDEVTHEVSISPSEGTA